MNKLTTAALGLAVAVLPVLGASPAFAADTGPDTNACEKAKIAEGNALQVVREAERALRDAKALSVSIEVDLPEPFDSLKTKSEAELGRIAVLERELKKANNKLDDVVEKREEKCAEDPEPTPTTTPATPTTPANEDVDCDEVTDARAQEILDADRNDPHNLDDDNDGVACEEEGVLVADNDSVVVAPSGGVNTGGWRR